MNCLFSASDWQVCAPGLCSFLVIPSHATVCAQVTQEDLHRVAEATGAQIQTTVNNLDTRVLGTCADFEEQQVGPHCLQQH